MRTVRDLVNRISFRRISFRPSRYWPLFDLRDDFSLMLEREVFEKMEAEGLVVDTGRVTWRNNRVWARSTALAASTPSTACTRPKTPGSEA